MRGGGGNRIPLEATGGWALIGLGKKITCEILVSPRCISPDRMIVTHMGNFEAMHLSCMLHNPA